MTPPSNKQRQADWLARLGRLPEWLLLRHRSVAPWLLLTVAGLITSWLAWSLLVTEPANQATDLTTTRPRLSTPVIVDITAWLAARNEASQRGLVSTYDWP